MATQYIERPSPTYRSCVAISRIAHYYEYPKGAERFIWGIPSKYSSLADREISALVSCWIYDGSRKSLEIARQIDSIFDGSPSKFVLQRKHVIWLMSQIQDDVVYDNIKIADCYNLLVCIHQIYTRYGSIRTAMELAKADTIHEKILNILSPIFRFKGSSINSEGRRNLFLFMMVHCFEEYDIPSTELKAPLFEAVVIPNARSLNIITKKTKKKQYVEVVTNNLKWFSEQYPMTFWIGIAAYSEYQKEHPKLFKKFAQQTVVLRRFKKR